VFHPAWLGINLPVFLLGGSYLLSLVVKKDKSRACGALIDGADELFVSHGSLLADLSG
jgi:hypothetical protein